MRSPADDRNVSIFDVDERLVVAMPGPRLGTTKGLHDSFRQNFAQWPLPQFR